MTKPSDPTSNQPPGGNKPQATRVPAVRNEPVIAPPLEILQRYNARVLDPTTALQVAGQTPVRPTVYIANRLIVSGASDEKTRGALQEAARRYGLALVGDEPQRAMRSHGVAARARLGPERLPIRVRLVPASAEATAAPDAWNVLQTFRSLIGRDAPGQKQVALDHLLTAARHTSGSPFVPRGGYDGTVPSGSYGLPGWGGRQPVNWVGPGPIRIDPAPARRPVVAVLDTGVAEHEWLPPEIVHLENWLSSRIVDPEITGVTLDSYEGTLDQDAGHGTFIAGLIRQQCPHADILAIPVMGGDGIVAESDLLDALHLLLLRQQSAVAGDAKAQLVDVVSLSLGYYHEQPDDITFDSELLIPLRALGILGVAVVVAAGNDATDRPMFPAAFAPWSGGPVTAPEAGVPVISVGALNPNDETALFSNAGEWVTCHHPGAALVSTFPKVNASAQAAYSVLVDGDGRRSTLDPDDFTAGFAVWSGTSFSAPVLAGKLAAKLCQTDMSTVDEARSLSRGWSAVSACVERYQR